MTAFRYAAIGGFVVTTALSAGVAAAQRAESSVPAIECGAGEGQRQSCTANPVAGAVLTRQTGSASCVLGRTWGFDAGSIWTSNGCRGTFAVGDTRTTVTCAAAAGAREVCVADTAQGVAFAKGSPSCVLGNTWGYDSRSVWVANGCAGTFVLSTRRALSCDSGTGGRHECDADTSAGVVLTRTAGETACVLGETWGVDTTGVWVDRGCRGEFLLGQIEPEAGTVVDADSSVTLLEPYGRFRGQLAFFKDEVEVQDNSSYVGVNFSTRGAVTFFATAELRVSLMRGGQQFNAGETTRTGFPNLEDRQVDQVFGSRLGFVGLTLGGAGRFAIGKQPSVHMDISRYTDRFWVFGGQASATYTAGTDGGILGSGRADQAVTYRNTFFRVLDVGGQLQFQTLQREELIDGAGLSAQLTILPGVRVGGAYTRAFSDDASVARIRGLHGDVRFIAVGAQLGWRVVEAAVVYANQQNGDLARVGLPDNLLQPIAFDADGVEAFLRVNLRRSAVYGGFNYYRPDTVDPLLDPNFRTRYGVAGAEFGIAGNSYAYVEARIFDDSVGPQGEEGFDVFIVGMYYGFSFKRQW